jgi:PBP1b-binding outer membrane lipoprotein LpoB
MELILKNKKHWICIPIKLGVISCVLGLLLINGGCATPSVGSLSSTRVLQPDQEDDMGGTFLESSDIRTIASRMTPEILSVPEIVERSSITRIAIAPIRNNTRFIVDKDIFMRRLRIELNRVASGRIRFFSQGMGQGVREDILAEQDEDIWNDVINEVAESIATSPIVVNTPNPIKVAVIPVKNTNIVNLNADSFTALIRAKISEKAHGKITFLAREANGKAIDQILAESDLRNFGLVESIKNNKIAGVDYFLGGEFIAESLSVESSKEVLNETTGRSKDDPRVFERETSTTIENPNVTKYLNVMLIDAQTGVIPVEKLAKIERKMKSGLASSDYILTGEISALTKAAGGDRSDYIIISFQLVSPQTNELIWEDAYETKKVTNRSVLYK